MPQRFRETRVGRRDGRFAKSTFVASVHEAVRLVPEGRVVTYGQVAALAGRPLAARQVGYLLAALPEGSEIPWHRVINARGEVSRRAEGSGIAEGFQRHLLEEEGVRFDSLGRVDLARYRWEPQLRPAPKRQRD